MKIKSFGSSSKGNCIALQYEDQYILLDCGIRPETVLAGMEYKLPVAVLVQHSHKDHCKYAVQWAKRGVDIYMSEAERKEAGLSGHRFIPIWSGGIWELLNFTVYPFKAIHDTIYPLNFMIDTPDARIVYSTDTKGVIGNAPGITHYITECNFDADILKANVDNGTIHRSLGERIYESHKSINMLIYELEHMDRSCLEQVYLCHLSDRNSNEAEFKRRVQEVTGVEVYVL